MLLCIDSAYLFTELIAELRSIENKSHSSNRKQSLATGISWGVHFVMETRCQGSTQDKILIRIKMLCEGISGSQRWASEVHLMFDFPFYLSLTGAAAVADTDTSFLPSVSRLSHKQPGPINYLQQLSNTRHGTHLLSQHQENQEK